MDRLISDLTDLEKFGIRVLINGNFKTFRFTLLDVAGDNLGSHQIGGFCENFSNSNYFCRYCEIAREDFYSNIFCIRTLRTVENYNTNVEQAIRNKQPVKGVASNSALNKLNTFHVAGPGLPPCIAHDCDEGFLKVDMFLIVQYFIKKGWFDVNFFFFPSW